MTLIRAQEALKSMEGIGKLNDIVHFLEKKWYEKMGLVAALLTTCTVEIPMLIAGKVAWPAAIIIVSLSMGLVAAFWFYSRRLPRTSKGKIGFIVSIASSNDIESQKLREDFVIPLKKLVTSGQAGKNLHFMELPQHLASKAIDPDEARAMRKRARAHFMLFGRVRLRIINGEEHHVLDLDGVVAHSPVPQQASSLLGKEFTELLPRNVLIPTENDIFSFQFTTEWADIVARYILGVGAAFSGDFTYSETLFMEALNRLAGKSSDFPAYQKLANRIPDRVSELYEARAKAEHLEWVKTHDTVYLQRLGEALGQVRENRLELPHVLNLRALHAFLTGRDVEAAIGYLMKRKDETAEWHLNMAFLYGYKGDLRAAARHYRFAGNLDVEGLTITQVEDFICWVLEQEPEKYWLHYCLGMFNWRTKGDTRQAVIDFREFLHHADNERFPKEIELAGKWVEEFSRGGRWQN